MTAVTTVQELNTYIADMSETWWGWSFPVVMGTGTMHTLIMRESIKDKAQDLYHEMLPGDTLVFHYAKLNSSGAFVGAQLHVRQNMDMNAIPCITKSQPWTPDTTSFTVFDVSVERSKYPLSALKALDD